VAQAAESELLLFPLRCSNYFYSTARLTPLDLFITLLHPEFDSHRSIQQEISKPLLTYLLNMSTVTISTQATSSM